MQHSLVKDIENGKIIFFFFKYHIITYDIRGVVGEGGYCFGDTAGSVLTRMGSALGFWWTTLDDQFQSVSKDSNDPEGAFKSSTEVNSPPASAGGEFTLNHRLYNGFTGLSGEIGHTSINFNGPPCF